MKGQREEVVEKAEEGIILSFDDKGLPVRRSISHGIRGAGGSAWYVLSRAVVFSFGMNDRHFGEEDVRLPNDLVRSNKENDVSPKESSCFIAACIDFVVSAAVATRVSTTACAAIVPVIQVAVRVDQRRSPIVPVGIIGRVFRNTGDCGTVDGLVIVVVVLKLDSSVEHGNRSATKVRSHQYSRVDVMALLFISIYVIIVDPMVEEDMVHIINTADPPFLWQLAESVLIYEDFLVLPTIY